MSDTSAWAASCPSPLYARRPGITSQTSALVSGEAAGAVVVIWDEDEWWAPCDWRRWKNEVMSVWQGVHAYVNEVQAKRLSAARASASNWRWLHALETWEQLVGGLESVWSQPLRITKRFGQLGCTDGFGAEDDAPAPLSDFWKATTRYATASRLPPQPDYARPTWERVLGPIDDGSWANLRVGTLPTETSLTKAQRLQWLAGWELTRDAPTGGQTRVTDVEPTPRGGPWGERFLQLFAPIGAPDLSLGALDVSARTERPRTEPPRALAFIGGALIAGAAGWWERERR